MGAKKQNVGAPPPPAPAPPQLTAAMLRAERARLDEVREKLWADLNQAIGAARQLEVLIEHLEGKPCGS